MAESLRRLFRLRPGEAGIAVTLGLILMINSVALNVSDVVAVSGFISQVGTPEILIVWLVDMGLILLTTSIQAFVIDRYARLKLLRVMSFIVVAAFVILRVLFAIPGMPIWLNYSLLFLLGEQLALFLPLVFWVYANDILELSQAKRLFPFIASFAFIGQILGLGIAALSPGLLATLQIESSELLTLNALLFMVAFALMWGNLSKMKVRETVHKSETAIETLTEGWGFIREVPSFRFLVVALLSGFVVLTILDFNFLLFIDTQLTMSTNEFQRFYGLFYLGLTVASFVVQILVTSRLIQKFELKNTFLVTPVVMLVAISWLVIFPRFIMVALALALGYLARDAVDSPAGKAFQALVPEERRGRVSIFMDSYMYAVGTILGCVVIGAILLVVNLNTQLAFSIYLPVGVAIAAVAVLAILRMRGVYDSSLLNWRLKRRTRGASVLDKLEF